ncbi:BZ3500_MvSof-1268-A1-R1_Chr4-3g07348 [Microbotryum saponariae]|uniref:BZ3500_MvSof-1268-A1-R1_Chr4-3g07348 protein n=1 Tax=Microbotryum saponariae TaxID=289078 RepID=A0A2X0LIX5_9BASI|nr:BZ3500_MvSof-1268-A1-R1_Chr4-3g07348 [Microbotryum saponariae]SDA07011.1 BZ3501_MvSof-1269-A2-R1_Chr4-2g07057 [Microbotryum saponariae]
MSTSIAMQRHTLRSVLTMAIPSTRLTRPLPAAVSTARTSNALSSQRGMSRLASTSSSSPSASRRTSSSLSSSPLSSWQRALSNSTSQTIARTSSAVPTTATSTTRHPFSTSALARAQATSSASWASPWGRFNTLSSLRTQASNDPSNLPLQRQLFTKLLHSPKPQDQEELIGRYEELSGLWMVEPAPSTTAVTTEQQLTLLNDDDLFAAYLRALAARAAVEGDPSSYFAKLNTALPIRQGKLASSAAATPAAPSTTEAAAASSSTPSSPSSTASAPTTTPALTPAALVTALFSGAASRGKGGDARVVSGGSSWPFSSGSSSTSSGGPEPIRVVVEEVKSPLALRMLRFILITVLYSFLLLSLLSLLLDSSGILRAGAAQTTPFQTTPPPDPHDPSGRGTTFKDVHGVEEAKEELYEIVEFLKDPERFSKLGGRLPRGVLLTGKTLLARAVAGEAGVSFFSASGSEFDEMYVGVGARRIRELFATARKNAPSIIFIDEIDAIGGKRSPREQHYIKQTLNQLLTELDGFSPGEGVILIGATNFPESLDKALVRAGRFDRIVAVPLPDVRGRAEILKHHMRNIQFDRAQVDITTLARGTIGFSGADLQALVNQAAVKASSDHASAVRSSHFEWAKERIMMGAARKSAFISETDKLATAYHEGGHALVALYTKGAYPLQSITVVPRGNALGYTLMLPEADKNSHSLSEYRAKLDVAMGGRVAEELIYGKDHVTDGASSDISNATSMASNMVRRFGFSDLIGPVAHSNDPDSQTSPDTQAKIEQEVRGLIEEAQNRARNLLLERKEELDRLAKALVRYETLTLKEVEKVVKGEEIEKDPLDLV